MQLNLNLNSYAADAEASEVKGGNFLARQPFTTVLPVSGSGKNMPTTSSYPTIPPLADLHSLCNSQGVRVCSKGVEHMPAWGIPCLVVQRA